MDIEVQNNDEDVIYENITLQTRNVENFLIIWLDSSINEMNDDTKNSIIHLRKIVNSIKTFTESNQCIQYLISIKNENIFMIISGLLGQKVIPEIEHLIQLRWIYIFCVNKPKYEQWSTDYQKIQGVYTHIEDICNVLKHDVQHSEIDLMPISIVAKTSSSALDELDQSYMYSQLLKDILLELEPDNKAVEEFTKFCRIQYADNDNELKIIEEFQSSYHNLSSIWWYTRDCFTHSMLNKALRTLDIEIILKMGFFIRDLHQQLKLLQSESNNQEAFILYRGQGMLNNEFKNLQNSIGCLLSFKNFLSTSTDKDISLDFARIARENSDMTAILFRMKIDPSISSIPFASLDKVSFYSDKEKEILISTHTIFRIRGIKKLEERLWQVNLTLTNDNDEERIHLTEYIRKQIEGPSSLHRLGSLMIKMGELKKAEEIYTNLLSSTSNDDRSILAYLHHQLGYIKSISGNTRNAMHYYNRSVEIEKSYLPLNNPQLCPTYSNMGNIFLEQGRLDNALEYFERALDIERNASQPDVIKIATLYDNMGGVFKRQGKYTEALQNYDDALNIRLAKLPCHHPSLAAIYNNIAGVHFSLKDYSKALSYYEKTLEIDKKSLPYKHPSLITTYSNMAKVLEKLHRYEEAFEHMKRAVDIAQYFYSSENSEIQLIQKYFDRLQRKYYFNNVMTQFS
jgi:tetratricopeptide (TPR) repeat protein